MYYRPRPEIESKFLLLRSLIRAVALVLWKYMSRLVAKSSEQTRARIGNTPEFLPLRFLSLHPATTLDPRDYTWSGHGRQGGGRTHACELAKRVIPPVVLPRNGFNVSQFRPVPFRIAWGTAALPLPPPSPRNFCFPLVDFNIVQAHRHSVAEAPPRSAIIHDSMRDAYL